MTVVLAFIGALVIGLSLGLLGSGGSILTIPVLVLILGRPEKVAIAEALAIVGLVSLFGSLFYASRKEIDWKSVLVFGLPGMAGAWAGGYTSYYISGSLQMTFFALTLLAASGLMLFGPASFEGLVPGKPSAPMTLIKGFVVGYLTGLLGIGGGFLIVPSLIILCGLSISTAVGSSLVIISMNCFVGFNEQLIILHGLKLNVSWSLIGIISAVSMLGCYVGSFLSKKVSPTHLRRLLGCAVFLMGVGILIMQRSE